jgi:hypothetical protein
VRELPPPVRLGLFGAALVAVLVGSVALGRSTGTVAQAAPASSAEQGVQEEHGGDDHAGAVTAPTGAEVTGTSLSAGGLRLAVPGTTLPPLRATPFRFQVLGAEGPLREYDVEQGKRMHLVIVSRDLSRHAHVHPELGADGTWSVLLTLSPGSYRAVADFSTGGQRRSLAVDLTTPGPLAPAPLPPEATLALADGLRVELERAGSTLSFTAYDSTGSPVVPEPYLGARGHLVAFRAGDLAYAHVHPSGEDGATTSYDAELPGPGTYRLFLELQVDGRVRTAPYTLVVP